MNKTLCVIYADTCCQCVRGKLTEHRELLRHIFRFCWREAAKSGKSDEPIITKDHPTQKSKLFDRRF
jgi:hypothetical protein